MTDIVPGVDAPRPSRLLARTDALTPFPTLERVLRPVLRDAMRFVERWVGGIASVRRRLEQLGSATTVEQFRGRPSSSKCVRFASPSKEARISLRRTSSRWSPSA